MKEKKILLFEKWLFLICKTLNTLYTNMLCAKYGWKWSDGSGDFKIFQCIFTILLLISQ